MVGQLGHGLSGSICLIDTPHHVSPNGVNAPAFIRACPISQGRGPGYLAVLGGLRHSTGYILRQFSREILCHRLDHALGDDSSASLRDVLRHADQPHTGGFQLAAVQGALSPVTEKAVVPPDQNAVHHARFGIPNQAAKIRPILRPGGFGPVYVFAHNGDVVAVGILLAYIPLTLNAQFLLFEA